MYANHPREYDQLILIGLLPMAVEAAKGLLSRLGLNGGRANPAHNEAYGTVSFAKSVDRRRTKARGSPPLRGLGLNGWEGLRELGRIIDALPSNELIMGWLKKRKEGESSRCGSVHGCIDEEKHINIQ